MDMPTAGLLPANVRILIEQNAVNVYVMFCISKTMLATVDRANKQVGSDSLNCKSDSTSINYEMTVCSSRFADNFSLLDDRLSVLTEQCVQKLIDQGFARYLCL